MRFIIPAVAALALLAFQAQAQTAGTAAPAPAQAPAATTTVPAAPATTTKSTHAQRQTLQQRFDAANTAHDGHLTKDQAQATKWTYVTRHFTAIDKDNKGFVTADDIHAYSASAHHARHHVTTPATQTPASATQN
jgi:hypothetical protein